VQNQIESFIAVLFFALQLLLVRQGTHLSAVNQITAASQTSIQFLAESKDCRKIILIHFRRTDSGYLVA